MPPCMPREGVPCPCMPLRMPVCIMYPAVHTVLRVSRVQSVYTTRVSFRHFWQLSCRKEGYSAQTAFLLSWEAIPAVSPCSYEIMAGFSLFDRKLETGRYRLPKVKTPPFTPREGLNRS